MQIESLRIRNFRVFNDIQVENIPQMAVFMGQNGAGKTTFFDMFGFLHDCLNNNVRSALAKRGGFAEVISRDQTGDMQFEIKFRPSPNEPVITYELTIGLSEKQIPVVKKEVMRFRRGQHGAPWKILDFSYGEGLLPKENFSPMKMSRLQTERHKEFLPPTFWQSKDLGSSRISRPWLLCAV